VILVDDLRGPGHAFYQGRSWSWSVQGVGIAAGVKALQLQSNNDEGILVEGFFVNGPNLPAANSFVSVYVGGPSDAVPNNATFLIGAWRDNKTTTPDQPPLLAPVSFAALTGTGANSTNVIWACMKGSPLPTGVIPIQAYLPKNGWIGCQIQDVVDITFGCYGRIWPQ
jgi:hypothetical protein